MQKSKEHAYSYRTWLEISSKNIGHNFNEIKKIVGRSVLMLGVVKSNAYGHELLGFSKSLAQHGIDWLGTDSISEALAIRKQNIKKPILVMGYTLPENFKLAADNNISLTISQLENLTAALNLKSSKPLKIHIKIDSGMLRQGFFPSDIPKVLYLLKKYHSKPRKKQLVIEGVYTHFASAKNPYQPAETEKQIKSFEQALGSIKNEYPGVLVHAAATGATINYKNSHYDMVRVGAGLYGLWPAEETKKYFNEKIKLKPVLSWKSIVSEIKKAPHGNAVGYNFTRTLERDSVLAVVPIGYWHGYPRALSNKSSVLINGEYAPILGNISMDMLVVDITDIKKVHVGSEVVLIGQQGKNRISADDLAVLCNTINYEIVTRINPLIKKFYI